MCVWDAAEVAVDLTCDTELKAPDGK
ncbi:hypothetical protein Nmel_002318 [Mimus melanotis]